MKKELREKLTKYASAAAALTGVASVNAQVVYTDVTPDITVDDPANTGGFTLVGLDMDNDATPDFVLAARDTTFNGFELRYTLVAPNGSNNAIAYASTSTYGSSTFIYASAMNNGDMIDVSLMWSSATNTMAFDVNTGAYQYGNWNGVTDKYLGLRFDTGGNTYYGWARLDVAGDVFTLKDYAYEGNGSGITAGDMGPAGIDDATVETLVHFINQPNNSVKVKVNGGLTDGQVTVLSTSGQVVSAGAVVNDEYIVDMNGLSAGVYIINVDFAEGSTTKKMIVH